MALYSAKDMAFPVYYPNPELLDTLLTGSTFRIPEKVQQVMGRFALPAPHINRPYLYGCMVLSFDGKMGFSDNPEGHLISKENTLDPIGGLTDFWIMNVCRTYADGVILGTNTLKARIHKLWFAEITDVELVQARSAMGKETAQPVNIIASIDGMDVPLESQILDMTPAPVIMTSLAGAQFLKTALKQPSMIITEPKDSLTSPSDTIRILASGEEFPDTNGLMSLLREMGICYAAVEAPGYIWHLIQNQLLDEYILNYSGVLAGGQVGIGNAGPHTVENHPHSALLSIGYHKSFIYTRQKLIYGENAK